MRSMFYAVVFSLTLAVPGFSQLVAEHAAAVAGGGLGVMAGKPVSDAITKVMDSVEKAPTQKPKPVPKTKPAEAQPAPALASAPQPDPPKPAPALRPVRKPAPAERPAEVPVVAVARPIEAITEPDLSQASAGMLREQLFAAVGKPSSRVTIPDEGHLLEICRYTYGERWLGTVRLDNGTVVGIERPR
jgi:outer membrane biosynthesis protein TonB